jgi:hypothetical protein
MVAHGPTDGSKTNGRQPSAPRIVALNLAELSNDALTMADLQMRLAWADTGRLLRDLIYPGSLLVAGVVLVLGCVPFALVTIAIAMDEATRLTLAQASALTLAGGLIVGALTALAAVLWIRRGLRPFQRSLSECELNLKWIKKILQEQAASSQHADQLQH